MGSNRGLVAIRQRRLHFADYRARLQQRQVHAASNVGFSRIVSSYSWPRVILAFFPTSHSAVAKSVDVVGIERAARPTGTNSRIPMHAAVASGAATRSPASGSVHRPLARAFARPSSRCFLPLPHLQPRFVMTLVR